MAERLIQNQQYLSHPDIQTDEDQDQVSKKREKTKEVREFCNTNNKCSMR